MTNYKDKLLLSNCTFFYFVFSLVCVYGQGLLGRRRRAIQEIPVKAGKLDGSPPFAKGTAAAVANTDYWETKGTWERKDGKRPQPIIAAHRLSAAVMPFGLLYIPKLVASRVVGVGIAHALHSLLGLIRRSILLVAETFSYSYRSNSGLDLETSTA